MASELRATRRYLRYKFDAEKVWTSVDWWVWALGGLVLLAVELASPGGFYVFFFAVGALTVALLAATGEVEALWVQGLLFATLSVVSLLSFRRRILDKMQAVAPSEEVDSFVGTRVLAREQILPGKLGKAELRGTSWNARNAGETPIASNQWCRVERVDGLTLWIHGD